MHSLFNFISSYFTTPYNFIQQLYLQCLHLFIKTEEPQLKLKTEIETIDPISEYINKKKRLVYKKI